MMVRITNIDDSFSLDTFLLDKLNKGGGAKRLGIDSMIMFLEYKNFMLCKQQECFWLALICDLLFCDFVHCGQTNMSCRTWLGQNLVNLTTKKCPNHFYLKFEQYICCFII